MRIRSLLLCAWLVVGLQSSAVGLQAASGRLQQPPGDFVPVDETQPGEQIPALPLLASAYGFIWVVMLGYVWSIGRRLQKVESELADLESRRS